MTLLCIILELIVLESLKIIVASQRDTGRLSVVKKLLLNIHKNGWLDLCCGHMVETRKPEGYWTIELCQDAALKYSSRSEWNKSIDSASYKAAYKKGWLDLCCGHMVQTRKPEGYWTLERCQAAARKYAYPNAWKDSIDSASHKAAYKNGWLELCCGHMVEQQKPPGHWTLELCQAAALKYSSRTEWMNSIDSASHKAAYKKGWLDQCCDHMVETRKPEGYWTLELCKAAALKYLTKTAWKNSIDSASHKAAYKKGWLDLCCEHMKKKG